MQEDPGLPPASGLYDPRNEHDACGVGFVVDIKGRKSQRIVSDALQVLENLRHRGACGCEVNTGDGAGILVQMPDRFLRNACREAGLTLPPLGDYGTGIVFLPREESQRVVCRKNLEDVARAEGLELLGWRKLPTASSGLGPSALKVEPAMEQIFLGRGQAIAAGGAGSRTTKSRLRPTETICGVMMPANNKIIPSIETIIHFCFDDFGKAATSQSVKIPTPI